MPFGGRVRRPPILESLTVRPVLDLPGVLACEGSLNTLSSSSGRLDVDCRVARPGRAEPILEDDKSTELSRLLYSCSFFSARLFCTVSRRFSALVCSSSRLMLSKSLLDNRLLVSFSSRLMFSFSAL